jgi:hypothetical protein
MMFFNKFNLLFCLLIWLVLFFFAAANYHGSILTFSIFSLSFLILLIVALYNSESYSFLFLSLFLWLGFWFKLVIHLIFDYEYVEPAGVFDGSKEAWDHVLWVATIACLGVISGRLLYMRFRKPIAEHDGKACPAWYPSHRGKLWFFLLITIVVVAVLNAVLGIQQIGLAARTILPWPMNAVIAWLVSIGSAMAIATLVWWDIGLKKPIGIGALSILAEAFLSTASLLSRGVFIFHSVPQLFALYKNRLAVSGLSKFRVVIIGLSFFLLFFTAIALVTTLRSYFYPHTGGFTTEEQLRLTRMEVLEGGIMRVKALINQGEPQEKHLLELLKERSKLRNFKVTARLEVLQGGIMRVKTLIAGGERQGGHLSDLLEEKSRLERSLIERAGFEMQEYYQELTGIENASIEGVLVQKPASLPESAQRNETISLKAGEMMLSSAQGKVLDEMVYQLREGAIQQIMALVVDRWVGLEGVMAVASYPSKNTDLLIEAIKEKREVGKVTRYQEIAKSSYQWTDSSVWQFASLPGAVAFLYFSGSLWIVFTGMIIFTLVLQVAELAVYKATRNPILCSLLGMVLANFVSQFGITPRQDLPYFLMITIGVITIAIVQNLKQKSNECNR